MSEVIDFEDNCALLAKMRLEAVLEDKYLREDIDTMEVYITYLNEKKELSSKLQLLTKTYPMDVRLQHLKRVKAPTGEGDSYRIIVATVEDHEFSTLVKNLEQINFKLVNVTKVPASKPLTRIQYEKAKALWPVSFFENKFIAHCLSGNVFKDAERKIIAAQVEKLLGEVRQMGRNITIVAEGNEIIARAADSIDEHPLHHSAINVIQQVARDQLEASGQSLFATCCSNPLYEEIAPCTPPPPKVLPYLCTSNDAYMSNEPCVMCAMALIHSRIKRLFFIDPYDIFHKFGLKIPGQDCMNDGAVQKMKIHTRKGLNHHFTVFRIRFD